LNSEVLLGVVVDRGFYLIATQRSHHGDLIAVSIAGVSQMERQEKHHLLPKLLLDTENSVSPHSLRVEVYPPHRNFALEQQSRRT